MKSCGNSPEELVMPRKRPTLVTGGTGFVGRRLVNRLLDLGERVRLLVRKTSDTTLFAGKPVELAYGDVTDRASVEAALQDCGRLYHLAKPLDWWTPDYSLHYQVNVEGTRNVMESALTTGVERAVYTGSYLTLFGEGQNTISGDSQRRGRCLEAYTHTKYLGEQEALRMAERGLAVVSVLPTAIYGPGDTTATGRLLISYLRRRLPALIDIRANLVYVDDVVEGHIAAIERGKAGERYILGGDNISGSQILALIAEMEGRRWVPPRLPHWMALAAGAACEILARLTGKPSFISRDFVRHFSRPLYVDSTKARSELEFSFTPLREGLRRYIDWAKAASQM